MAITVHILWPWSEFDEPDPMPNPLNPPIDEDYNIGDDFVCIIL